MNDRTRFLWLTVLLTVFLGVYARAAESAFKLFPYNTRAAMSGRLWTGGTWAAFCVDETDRSLNEDTDTDDAVLMLCDTRSFTTTSTRLALDFSEVDNEEEPPVVFGRGYAAFLVSESDQGGADLNKDGKVDGSVIVVWNLATRQFTPGVSGHGMRFIGDTLYFVYAESAAKRDLNGDGDLRDSVLCSFDPIERKFETLGMEADAGFVVAGDWIATYTAESAQGAKDLNGDRDTLDLVAMLYSVKQKQWVSSGLEVSGGMALTPQLLAAACEEGRQGKEDLNRDGDATDTVCQIFDLTTRKIFNTALDCGAGLVADRGVVGLACRERAQGQKDLNKDGDVSDDVVHVYTLGTDAARNLELDGSGGIAATGGKIVFSCDELNQGKRDLNRDKDSNDIVLHVYDPAQASVHNTAVACEGPLQASSGRVLFKVPEADQGDRDLNGDRDLDDLVPHLMDVGTYFVANTRLACSMSMAIGSHAIAFPVTEFDQGDSDLNRDGDRDDDIAYVVRVDAARP